MDKFVVKMPATCISLTEKTKSHFLSNLMAKKKNKKIPFPFGQQAEEATL